MKKTRGNEQTRKLREAMFDSAAEPGINPLYKLVEVLCSVRVEDVESLDRPRDGNVRIAFVSMPLIRDFDYHHSPPAAQLPRGVTEESVKRTLATYHSDESQRILKTFKGALKSALVEHRANVVCVSELGFPSENMRPLDAARAFAYEMSEKHKALIIAGSAHDSRTYFNTGLLFHPGGPKSGLTFHKTNSAWTMKEKIAAPSKRHILVVETLGLKIATLICLDIADYAHLAALMKVGERVDMLLVPCLTERFDSMLDIATMASRALPGVVALVNVNEPRFGATTRHIISFGQIRQAHKVKRLRSGAEVATLTLNIDEYRRAREHVKRSLVQPHVDWLFGDRDRQRMHDQPRRRAVKRGA